MANESLGRTTELDLAQAEKLVRAALREDHAGRDLTSEALVARRVEATGEIVPNTSGVVAGLPVARLCFQVLDEKAKFHAFVRDGESVKGGEQIAQVTATARAILMGERVALNFLQRLSGIATLTRQCVDVLGPGGPTLLDTRKTTPLLRMLEKYAVCVGGGKNHRSSLSETILVKDNHIAVCGGVTPALKKLFRRKPQVLVEVEVETVEQAKEALKFPVSGLLLDNMTKRQVQEVVELAEGKGVFLEVSGGVHPEDFPWLRTIGVDYISMGALTMRALPLDLTLEVTSCRS